jgi:hypothetical protein
MRRFVLLLVPAALFAAQARYARLGDFEGAVDVQLRASDDWIAAERNLPLTEAAWVRTGTSSRAEIELDEGSAWRLGPNSQCEISDYSRLSTGQRITLLSLDHGLAYFTGHPEGKDSLMIAVPGAQVTLLRGARLRFEVEQSWSQISVMEGTVRFSSPAAQIDLHEGQTTRVEPANAARFFLNREAPGMELDRWSEGRDKVLGNTTSAAHVIERYGLADLDASGEWTQTEDLGTIWRPRVADGWAPFQNGRWRWYDTLGYTWVSGDSWGWLPYHYGRWTRKANHGWVWVPAKTAVFKPGEVYWLRGTKLAGWGPLAPGEDWTPGGTEVPVHYLNVNMTFAAFQQDDAVIDPEGFTGRPKEALRVAAFVRALPSPALAASRLDAMRPELRAGNTRVTPVIEGVTFQPVPAPTVVVTHPPPPPPVVIITEPPADPPDPVVVPAPYPYPVAVYTGIVNTPAKPAKTAPAKTAAPKPQPKPIIVAGPRHEKRFRPGEREVAGEVVKDIGGYNFPKALLDLDAWSQRYRDSDYRDDRLYYYVLAHNGMLEPAKVLDAAAPLVARIADNTLEDPRQMILVLYLASLNIGKVQSPTREQFVTARAAAHQLLDTVPQYFTPENRPSTTSNNDWTKARTDLEATAHGTLQALSARH